MRYNNIFRNKFKLKRLKCKIIIKRKVIPLKKRRYKWMQLNKNKKNRNNKNNNYMRCILMQQNKLMINNLKKIINQIINLQKKNLNKQMI